jgi:hypothetical protein
VDQRPSARRALPLIAVPLLAALATGCADDGATNAERFCGEIEVNQEALFRPELTTAADVEPLLQLYRDIGEFAPLAIEAEWEQLVVNYETASTVVPGDDASLQEVAAQAFQSEQAAATVKRWLEDNCALDIGPVATIVEQGS